MRVILVLLTIINISRVHSSIGLEKLRPGLILVVFAAGYAYMNVKSLTRANIMQYWPMRRVTVMGIVAVASVAFGIALGKSALFILDSYSKTILYAFLIALTIRHARDLYTYAWALAISCGILSFMSLFVYQLEKSDFSKTARVEAGNMYDANDVCVVLLVGLASTLLLMNVARGWRKGALLMIVMGIGAAIARSGSRGGFLGLVAFLGAALLLLNSISPMRRLFVLLAVAGGMALFAPPGYMAQMNTILNPEEDYNTSSPNGRKALIRRGLHYMAEYPVFGVGINAFGNAECEFSLSRIHTGFGGTRCGAPHNSFIQAAAETGAVGLVVWVSMVFGGIYAMLQLRRRIPRRWRRGNQTERFLYGATSHFALALIGFAVSAFFVSFAWIDILYLQLALISGLYLSIAVYKSSQAAAPASASAPSHRMPGWRVAASAQRQLAASSSRRLLAAPRAHVLPSPR
jgi:O-antigen ligase